MRILPKLKGRRVPLGKISRELETELDAETSSPVIFCVPVVETGTKRF